MKTVKLDANVDCGFHQLEHIVVGQPVHLLMVKTLPVP